MVNKPTVLPAQTSMCLSVYGPSMMCHGVMQRRNATLTDHKVGNSVCIRTYKCISWWWSSFVLAPPTVHRNLRINHQFCMDSVWGEWRNNVYHYVPFTWSLLWFQWGKASLCHQMLGFYSTDHFHGNGQAVYFCYAAKPANLKLATKTAKKRWILSFLAAKLPEKAWKSEILPRFQRWMKTTTILRVSFIILKIWKLLMQKLREAGPFSLRNRVSL